MIYCFFQKEHCCMICCLQQETNLWATVSYRRKHYCKICFSKQETLLYELNSIQHTYSEFTPMCLSASYHSHKNNNQQNMQTYPYLPHFSLVAKDDSTVPVSITWPHGRAHLSVRHQPLRHAVMVTTQRVILPANHTHNNCRQGWLSWKWKSGPNHCNRHYAHKGGYPLQSGPLNGSAKDGLPCVRVVALAVVGALFRRFLTRMVYLYYISCLR